jgi:hypothetical protein
MRNNFKTIEAPPELKAKVNNVKKRILFLSLSIVNEKE